MLVQFTKMHGLGNDFVVIDNVTQNLYLSPEQISKLADRHRGIGFDQLLMIEPPYDPDVDFHYRIFNADGSEVEQCGNGARCVGRFVRMKGLTNKSEIIVSTKKGLIQVRSDADGQVTVDMGAPILEPSRIPFRANKQEITYILRIEEHTFFVGALSMGNPHCVLLVDNVDTAAVQEIGALLTHYDRFPEGANIGFLQINSLNSARLRVFERGVGETQACGTGACAAAAWGILQGKLKSPVCVELPGGTLEIRWQPGESLWMRGPAEHVFDGQFLL